MQKKEGIIIVKSQKLFTKIAVITFLCDITHKDDVEQGELRFTY